MLSSVLIQAQAFSSSNYGILPFKPLEDLNIPEQGPGILIPQERRRSFALTTNSYGVPLAPVAPFAPVEDLNIPDQGPGLLVPQEQRTVTTNGYGVPLAPVAPISDIDLPQQVAPPVFAPILYQYQYETENSARQEVRDENGLTQGFYSYVDPNGQVRRVDYVSDPTLGYRVLNPVQAVQDTPEVTKAKEKFFKAYNLALQNNL